MNKQISSFVKKVTSSDSATKIQTVQSLWSGYGEIVRFDLTNCPFPSVIVKQIQLLTDSKHPRGWNSSLSHTRKLKSYKVESYFYAQYNQQCDKNSRTPQCLGIKEFDGNIVIVLEDLDSSGYPVRKTQVSLAEIKVCLLWLANFHANFMEVNPEGLWPIGTYWHLDTRPEELDALDDVQLKEFASKIDKILNECQFKTLVHGDAKLANFCFSKCGTKVAGVDFQYVGGGCGMKDVVYFIGSCLNETDCELYEKELLDFYFENLNTALRNQKSKLNFKELEKEWRMLFPVAWTDFHRFLKGWSPGHWKLNSYSEQMAQKVILQLGSKLNDLALKSLSNIAVQAAKEAGVYIKKEHNKQHQLLNKKEGSSLASQVVTEVDIKSQEIILSYLLPTCEKYRLGMLTEESADDNSRLVKNYFWCVDPLDGTLPFVEGREGFSVSIALVSKEGKSIIGVVYDPINKILYQAITGQGCLRNGTQWEINKQQNKDAFLFVTNRSFGSLSSYSIMKHRMEKIAGKFGCHELLEKQIGGSVMNAIWVLEEAPGCYVALPKKENGGGSIWDYAATTCIHNELGIPPVNCQGSRLHLNDKNNSFMNKQGVVFASNKAVLKAVLSYVSKS